MARVQMREPEAEEQVAPETSDERDTPEPAAESSDSPLLDLTDAAVKRMIKLAKQRGYVTFDELNAVLPSEEVTSEQIEDIYGDAHRDGHQRRRENEETDRGAKPEETERATENLPMKVERTAEPVGPHRRSGAHVSARDGLRSSFCRARARSPSPSASRPAARR